MDYIDDKRRITYHKGLVDNIEKYGSAIMEELWTTLIEKYGAFSMEGFWTTLTLKYESAIIKGL